LPNHLKNDSEDKTTATSSRKNSRCAINKERIYGGGSEMACSLSLNKDNDYKRSAKQQEILYQKT
jgi:hypothetical protein